MRRKNGFTILELLVVIAISAIVTGGSLATFSTFSKQQKLVNETQKMEDILATAKEKAISSENADICAQYGGNYTLAGYLVYITQAVNIQTTQVEGSCTDTTNPFSLEQRPLVSTYTIDPVVSVANLPITVKFAVITGSATVVGTMPITLQSSTSRKKCISISTVGLIDEVSCISP